MQAVRWFASARNTNRLDHSFIMPQEVMKTINSGNCELLESEARLALFSAW